jgi:amino acid transporter
VFRDEARDPERTIPRATCTALLLIGAFHTLSSWASPVDTRVWHTLVAPALGVVGLLACLVLTASTSRR